MHWLDWVIMLGTLFFIVGYGVWKTRQTSGMEGYLLGNKDMRWWTIGLSVMATQASAITFLSTPGQAYDAGMGFIQFYFGLPLAMVIISVVFIPIYYKLKVYTAYEFLESRFGRNTRVLTASLFLLSRGLAAGITIYAPAIILSQILDWSLTFTNIFIGALVIIYTVSGGTKAVSQTHKQQMFIIFLGMFTAFGFLVYYITEWMDFGTALQVAGSMGKMDIIDWEFNAGSRYNIWSGLIGGLFLQLSYFGTDQSQVQRYLTGSSVAQSRLGLLFNGLVKIPMQFFILLTGVLVFVFYQMTEPPLFFNEWSVERVQESPLADEYVALEEEWSELFDVKQESIVAMAQAMEAGDEEQAAALAARLELSTEQQEVMRHRAAALIQEVNEHDKTVSEKGEPNDYDYVFVTWVLNYLPIGIVGLLLAVIFSGAMSSTSAELNALSSTTTVDIYKRNINEEAAEEHYVLASRWFTFMFGILAILFATLASLFDNLIEAVNILGSLFYGTILGIFLVAFFLKRVGGRAVFPAAVIAEVVIIALFFMNREEVIDIGYLWYNLIGPALVVVLALIFQQFMPPDPDTENRVQSA